MGLFESIRTLTWCKLLASSVFLLLSFWHFHDQSYLAASLYLTGALLVAFFIIPRQLVAKHTHTRISVVVFILYTLLSLLLLLQPEHQQSQIHLSLHLLYPFLAFALLPFRIGLGFVVVYAASANLLLMLQLEGAFRAIFLGAFWLVVLLTLVYSFTQDLRRQKIQQQLNRDPRTQLLNRQQLRTDLHKEQERAQREQTLLGLICLCLPRGTLFDLDLCHQVTTEFSTFEGLYLVEEHQICALVPLASTEQLNQRIEQLQMTLPHLQIYGHHCIQEHSIEDNLKYLCAEKVEV